MGREVLAAVLALLLVRDGRCEQVRDLQVSEGAPVGVRVGFIGDGTSSPPYLIVPVPGSAVDTDLIIEAETGEIRTKVKLDRETRSSYSLVAIPRSGGNIRVVVKVLDENDNSPTFSNPFMEIEFPENTPRDVKRTLHPAKDLDLGIYNTQRYNIVSGNVNNAFRLSSHRERDGVLYLDLQINGFLDRETTSEYSLVIEALDGGNPPLRGSMTVNITIQDVNDNQPIFNQSRYFASIPENATVGTSVLQVFATDTDTGENGEIEYSINRRQSDRDGMFRIDPKSGLIAVNRPLDFESKEVHELVVVARDRGAQPLETTAFVSIRVTDVNDNQPTINVIFLSDDATPKISEMAQKGQFVARISVNDPDSKTEYSNVNVTLQGGEGHFGLATQDNIIYLVIVSMPLDRELKANYTLSVIATDTGTPPLHASRTFQLRVTDVNDNPPEFAQSTYHANVLEVADPGTSVIHVVASDRDEGENSVVTYSLREDSKAHAPWFQINPSSGLITTRSHIDCETEPVPKITVIATDGGIPPLSSFATVMVVIHDVNDNEPIFDHSFYNVTIPENEQKGNCILKVSATDPDCGINALVNYTLGESEGRISQLSINSTTGDVCIASPLDYEERSSFEFPVIATDRGGLSTRAMVKIQLKDVNDNWPTFYPREYNVSLREGAGLGPVVVVAATDRDSGRFGTLAYSISSGNAARAFSIDSRTGEISLSRPDFLASRQHATSIRLNVTATDGGGLRSAQDAVVYISVTDSSSTPPSFHRPRYDMTVSEDVPPNTYVGSVKAVSYDPRGKNVRYSIYSGDPDGYFTIDPLSGALRTSGFLDHETHSSLLLNVQATSGSPPAYGHAQVHIEIEDVNDNAPEFESPKVRISVRESESNSSPLYTAHAQDRDSGLFGRVSYRLATENRLFAIDAKTGDLSLKEPLDYEAAQRHSLVITASDGGSPPLTTNLTVLLEVQDVNDNAPVFERGEYIVPVSEALSVNSQVLQVTAVDLDTGNNARLTYKLLTGDDVFGIFPNSGWLYLSGTLDRETKDRYLLRVAAVDNGLPASTATTTVSVVVTDANDNDPTFAAPNYEYTVEEGLPRGAYVGRVQATDPDVEANAAITYSLVPSNSSFQINPVTGEITARDVLDREAREVYELVAEAKDHGVPPRASRASLRIVVSDVNDNAPEIVDPQEDVVSMREEQSPGTEVVRVRAVDRDKGANASVTYSVLKGREGEGWKVFSVDPSTGILRTRVVLEAGEKDIYRVTIVATDSGTPPRQSSRTLSVEVLALYDHRPTFSSSSLHFKVNEDAVIGYVVGNVVGNEGNQVNMISGRARAGHLMYSLTSVTPSDHESSFDLDRSSGSLVVTAPLDRERCSEYRLEVRALDTSTTINHQSSAVIIKVEIVDVNDNTPLWKDDLIDIDIFEDLPVGSSVWNLSATDADASPNGDVRYSLVSSFPESNKFAVDPLTGTLSLVSPLDFEKVTNYAVVVRATDQAVNASHRLSSSLTARINVKDANDNSPQFVAPLSRTVYVREATLPGETITRVLAIDSDSGENGRITYVISSGNAAGRFVLGYETGHLSLVKQLEVGSRYSVNVTASDHASPPRTGVISLTIVVKGVTESPPAFSQLSYAGNVSEDANLGTYVLQVYAKSSSEGPGNVSYWLNSDKFQIDSVSGVIIVSDALDRETRELYQLTVFAAEGHHYSAATVSITIVDVNDFSPRFPACYPLAIPENSDFAVIHRLLAVDRDTGANGEISYTITGGNVGNRFGIDLHSGELTARPLDREVQSRYRLVITAQDKGSPPLSGVCNLTVIVEDQNDNDPVFAESMYWGRLKENAPPGSFVLNVTATDQDESLNAKIIYSLANESQAQFRVDPDTGGIYTVGVFDREKQSTYIFQVIATDSGEYDARSAKVPIQINIDDVNDNKPIFASYPFRVDVPSYSPLGKELIKVSATDLDEGTNADIVYSFLVDPPGNKFRMDPTTGAITVTTSLVVDSGRLYHLDVVATDRGNPPQSASGLVEIRVGDNSDNGPSLRFQNNSYAAQLNENSPSGVEVVQVSALRSDGRRQKITYSIVSGNDEEGFDINSQTGLIRVRKSGALDFERFPEIAFIVQAEAEGLSSNSPLYGYAQVTVTLTDLNDNEPKFTQSLYSTTVWEGNSKGTFVTRVSATDKDQGSNSHLLYHLVDGNHDNAFIIEPSSSGIIKMNIVLDREIRDHYRLTVIATDEGVPQLTGTSTILINIVDVNDNQPTFPPRSTISVNEGREMGSVITTVTANDVDTHPALIYNLLNDDGLFSIDRFSGKVTLCHKLDFETRREYQVGISASDTAHSVQTVLTVVVTDDNDNEPAFSQLSYQTSVPDNIDAMRTVLIVSATDGDTGKNAKLKYSLDGHDSAGFIINENTGVIMANMSAMIVPRDELKVIDLRVRATDLGKPRLSTFAPVRINLGSAGSSKSAFIEREFKISTKESTLCGTSLLKMTAMKKDDTHLTSFSIIEGNINDSFEVIGPYGDLILVKPLDREELDSYSLKVTQGSDNATSVDVYVTIEDSNDNPPKFAPFDGSSLTVSENAPLGHSILELKSYDDDLPPNSDVRYNILSGNDEGLFKVDPVNGWLTVARSLDFDIGFTHYSLVVGARDSAQPPDSQLQTLAAVRINLKDENDNSPIFPVAEYLEFVGENEPIGSAVFNARATDFDRGKFGMLNYSVETSYSDVDDSWKLFKVDSATGLVTTNAVFDYESRNRYSFSLIATDSGGKSAKVKVRVEVESRDEFYPQFTERTYRFTMSGGNLPVGYVVGSVVATDRDKGPDGRIVYQLTNQHAYFKVNRTTGAIMIKKKIDGNLNTKQEVSFVVRASSGRQESLTNMTVVEIAFDPLAAFDTNLVSAGSNQTTVAASTSKVADWAIGLLISLIIVILCFGAVFLFLHLRNRRQKNVNKPGLGAVPNPDNFVDPSAFDTIPVRGSIAGPASQFGPPKYEEIPTYRNNKSNSSNSGAATSQISGSDQSGSSGRGSAEDGDDVEDEEIRMINEGIQREIHRTSDDNMSNVSVQNTQEYLARLGIVDTKGSASSRRRTDSVGAGSSKDIMLHAGVPIDGLRMFDEDATAEADITNLIYAKLTDVSGSDRASSAEEGNGSSAGTAIGAAVDHVIGIGAYGAVSSTHQPSMTGSLSSIVHSEEELTGSYNWDYLLDWGPQYQPLAHVFSEIARLKDDAASVKSGTSGTSSGKGKGPPSVKSVPPPLLTSVAPRSIAAPVLSARSSHHPPLQHQSSKMHLLPRSPINHDANGAVFGPSAAMSPSFSPALSPLATSPSLSPMVTPRHPNSHHVRQRTTDTELRI